jgi:hypothetical protein
VNDLSLPAFQSALMAIHGAHSRFERHVRVVEHLEDGRVWEGEVLVFALLDHPRAPWCYAWEVGGEVTAILHDDVAKSPEDAVRAALTPLGF